ncbi:ABC transporter ATP-binding protein [Bordetella sp. 2513F-2]
MSILSVKSLSINYGRNVALRNFSMSLPKGGLVAVLGANGAGKSSLLKSIAGLKAPSSGQIHYQGQDITTRDTAWRVGNGLSLVPEGRRILVSMTVHENLQMGTWCRKDKVANAEYEAIYDRFPNLARRRHMQASVLSGGEQQMLAIGRALLARPSVLLLDEPSLGLSPLLVSQLFQLIRDINNEGISIILIEQNIHKALQYASYAYVLDLGEKAIEGPAESLRNSDTVQAAYLGKQ